MRLRQKPGYDFTTDVVGQRNTHRGVTLERRGNCPTEVFFSSSHRCSKSLTREDPGKYRTPLAPREFEALGTLRATSLGTGVSVVTEKRSGDKDEKQEIGS